MCVCEVRKTDNQLENKQKRQFLTERRGREAAPSPGGVM